MDPSFDIARVRAGDAAAITAVWRSLGGRVYRVLLRLVDREELAAELLQETFLRLVRSAPSLPADVHLDRWLFVVARNLARSHWRWSYLDGERLLRLAAGWLGPASPPTVGQRLDDAERAAALERAIRELPHRQREVVALVAGAGLSYDEAAEVLGAKPEAVRQRWSRAVAALTTRGVCDAT